MDPNVGLDEVVHSDVVEEDDSNDLVITHVSPATPAMQQTDIYTLSRRHAERDPGDVPLVAPPTQSSSTTSSTKPTAPIFSPRRGTPSSSTPSSKVAAIIAQPSRCLQGSSTTASSGIGSSITSCGKTRSFQSPVWNFFSVHEKYDNIAVCCICKTSVSRGKTGTNYGTGGQIGHLERKHAVEWFPHLANVKGKRSQRASGQNIPIVGVSSEDDGEVEEASDMCPVAPSTPCSTTPSVTHSRHTESLGDTPMRKMSTLIRSGSKKASASSRKFVQRTISAMFSSDAQFQRNHPTVRLYNTKLAKMLAVDLLPFSFVEGVGFLELVATLAPKWKVPSRYYFARVAVPALHKEVLELVGAALQKSAVHTIHLTTDMWTSCAATDYMCITAHWVSFSGVIKQINAGGDLVEIFKGARKHATLAMFGMEKSHTAVNILADFNKKVLQWLRPRHCKVGYVSTDNGSNVVRAMADGFYFRVPCLAHCINLVVQNFLKKELAVDKTLTICRRICTHFNHSFKARKELRRKQNERRMPAKALIQEVATRWNSTFYMLERLHELFPVVNEYFYNLGGDTTGMILAVEQWQLVKSLTDMLRPFEVFTRDVSREDCSLSKAIPLLLKLEHQVKVVSSQLKDVGKNEAHELAQRLLQRLVSNERLVNIKKQQHYICATILDPRYKKPLFGKVIIPFETSDVTEYKGWLAQSAIRFEIERKETVGEDSTTSESAGDQASQKSTSPSVPVAEVSDFSSEPLTTPATVSSPPGACDMSEASWLTQLGFPGPRKDTEVQSTGIREDILSMVQAYLDDSTEVNITEDPLAYWHGKRKIWRELTNLAINYLSCPLASVSSERVFSSAGGIVTSKRSRLLPANVERLTLIKMNQHFIPPDYRVRECTQEEEDTALPEESSPQLPEVTPTDELAEYEDEFCFPDSEF
ncbi:zinc finger BED domain-containing protein 6-like [Lissotriton helveticus]